VLNCTLDSTTWEAVPRYFRMPRAALREQLRTVGLALLAAGERVSVLRLRECGVRGGTAALIAMRRELVAAGELPPEAAARVYAPPLHTPGKRTEDGATPQAGLPPRAEEKTIPPPSSVLRSPSLAKRRRSERLIRQYDSAVRRIFGRERARQIGATR
jgi:hypothetical protein